jgi:DNA-binding response OmpR family regulator
MGTVMIVDDQRTDRELAGRVVSSAGHLSVYVEDPNTAVERAEECKPGLILLDVVMPGLSGFNACRNLKQNAATAHIPVVLVTSKGAESDKFWGKKQGADDYIVKPFTPDQLKAVIDRYVR